VKKGVEEEKEDVANAEGKSSWSNRPLRVERLPRLTAKEP